MKNAPATIGNESARIAPLYPNPSTQPGRLLAALLRGRRIDPLTGWAQLGIYRLADTAFQLRKTGWPVVTGRRVVLNRYGEPCNVAEYYLQSGTIDVH